MIEREKTPLVPYLIKGKRDLSEFMARELLYDYAIHALDTDRNYAVQKAIQENQQLAKELDDILYGITYCQHLTQAVAKEEVIKKIAFQPRITETLKKNLNLRNWNVNILWVAEAMGIGFVFLLLMTLMPWKAVFDKLNMKSKSEVVINFAKEINSTHLASHVNDNNEVQNSQIDVVLELKVANSKYTIEKIPVLIEKSGASIFAVDKVKTNQFIITVPQQNKIKLLEELKLQGKINYIEGETQVHDTKKTILNLKILVESTAQVKPKLSPN